MQGVYETHHGELPLDVNIVGGNVEIVGVVWVDVDIGGDVDTVVPIAVTVVVSGGDSVVDITCSVVATSVAVTAVLPVYVAVVMKTIVRALYSYC